MQTIRVILGIAHLRVNWETNQELFRRLQCDVGVSVAMTTCAQDELAIACTLRNLLNGDNVSADDPVIVITSFNDHGEIPGPCARLLLEFPEATIISINSGASDIRTFRSSITGQMFPSSMKGFLDAFCECLRPSPPRAEDPCSPMD